MTGPHQTQDAFLGGTLTVTQPKMGYRAGIDPVLLAASVVAQPGQTVLDLGCGVGVASLCLGARVDGLHLTGVEVQSDYADLARRNAAGNDHSLEVVTADLAALPAEIRARRFDHVIANPPYFDRTHGRAARDAGREAALGENTPLKTWTDVATRRLVDGGILTVILRIDRLPDCLAALDARLGNVIVRPLAPRPGKPATLFLLQARKGGRTPFRLLAPLELHSGATHQSGAKDYTPQVAGVLQRGAALDAFAP